MDNVKISFDLTEYPASLSAVKNGQTSLTVNAAEGEISCSIYYDFDERPLTLTATAAKDDKISLVLMPHRIELYVNGTLTDEEWPKGNRFFAMGDPVDAPFAVAAEPYTEPLNDDLPAVLYTFTNADGWRPEENVFVGDCMPYLRDGEYHVLYLKDRHHHQSKWRLGAHQWEHISTKDFKKWAVHPMAVPITHPDEGSICTGSWIRSEDTEYLFYTVRHGRGIPATIARSVSKDGYHFKKDSNFGFTISEQYDFAGARDPKVIKGEDGKYHMFLTTSLTAEDRGCLAHLVSDDLDHWVDTDVPMYTAPDDDQPECPDYIFYNGWYYLFFGTKNGTKYLYSDRPFDGWKTPKNPVVPCGNVPKGGVWGDKIVFTGFRCMGGYAGTMMFLSATADENGELIFE